jgi:hypothetical protein
MIGRHYAGEFMNASKFKPTSDDVAAIKRALESIGTSRKSDQSGDMEILIEPSDIRRAIKGRRTRDKFFGHDLFADPAWDMLLDLFAAELENKRVPVTSLCAASAVAPTTALRWISKLTDLGIIIRCPDHFDKRKTHVALSERASLAMRRYIADMRREGLPLA